MTSFNSSAGEGRFRIVFETDNKEHYLHMERQAQKCIDGDLPCNACKGVPLMAEYIEREAAIEAVEAQCVDGKMYGRDDSEGTLVDAYDIIDAISNAPYAEVPTVDPAHATGACYCSECVNYNKPRLGWCGHHMDRENPDDFCSYGRRREDHG